MKNRVLWISLGMVLLVLLASLEQAYASDLNPGRVAVRSAGAWLGALVSYWSGSLLGYGLSFVKICPDLLFCSVGGAIVGSSIGAATGAHLVNGWAGWPDGNFIWSAGATLGGSLLVGISAWGVATLSFQHQQDAREACDALPIASDRSECIKELSDKNGFTVSSVIEVTTVGILLAGAIGAAIGYSLGVPDPD